MISTSRIWIGVKALRQLGLSQVGLYGLYQLGLGTGHYHRTLDAVLSHLQAIDDPAYYRLHPCMSLPDRHTLVDLLGSELPTLYAQADEVVDGKVRLFGGQPVPLLLALPQPLDYWTKYEGGDNRLAGQDIKFTWEPARFGWACTLARAYYLSDDEKYAEAFWGYTEQFISSNPAYFGPHWSSAQEVAIRLIALTFAFQIFVQSSRSTPERAEHLARALAIHAGRIPPTMAYARSQNNNHLITEALGLYTASAVLPDHPLAAKWHRLGWSWLQRGFLSQISPDGIYVQHSTNYHRLMLQAALWMYAIRAKAFESEPTPPHLDTRLATATEWIWQRLDPESGRVPNLGHNDGANILPLAIYQFSDYRPVVYAAARAFLNTNLEPIGPWTEMACWLSRSSEKSTATVNTVFWKDEGRVARINKGSPSGQYNPENRSWASLRVVTYHSRPAHADQLHVDLWWHGLNLAQDPGTYLYNSPPPWDNSLTAAFVHNTVTVDGHDFMHRAGRFLYLDWAQATLSASGRDSRSLGSITAFHNGYRKLGLVHSRSLTALINGDWEITDRVSGAPTKKHNIRLHWLLPDWEYELIESPDKEVFPWYILRVRSPYGWVALNLGMVKEAPSLQQGQAVKFQLVRAGQVLSGSGQVSPIAGWFSPTYGDKIPALACILEVACNLPVELVSLWRLPGES